MQGDVLHGLLNLAGGHSLSGDSLGGGVEADGHIADGGDGEDIVAVSVSVCAAPAVGPGTIGDLELQGADAHALIDLFVQTGLGIQGHAVGGVGGIPCGAEDSGVVAGDDVIVGNSRSGGLGDDGFGAGVSVITGGGRVGEGANTVTAVPHHIVAHTSGELGKIRSLIPVTGTIILNAVDNDSSSSCGNLELVNVVRTIVFHEGHSGAGPGNIVVASCVKAIRTDICPQPVILEIDNSGGLCREDGQRCQSQHHGDDHDQAQHAFGESCFVLHCQKSSFCIFRVYQIDYKRKIAVTQLTLSQKYLLPFCAYFPFPVSVLCQISQKFEKSRKSI